MMSCPRVNEILSGVETDDVQTENRRNTPAQTMIANLAKERHPIIKKKESSLQVSRVTAKWQFIFLVHLSLLGPSAKP